ncbi:MAG: GNAT family N-acetyltransferase [Acidobacteria bacterium]|nr:GNAT family N-acetyltransferase [Acidobacteriota bacterium]
MVALINQNLASSPRIKRLEKAANMLAGDDIPVPALEAFYEQMFPARAPFLKRHWRWLYRTDNRAKVKSPIVMLQGDEVVGHVGTIPLTLRCGNEERTAVWLCDIAVLSRYRGKAMGAFLLSEAMALSPMRIGFPNELSWRLISKFGWKDQLNTVGLSLLLHPEKHSKVKTRIEMQSNGGSGVKTLAVIGGLATRIVWRARAWPKVKLSVSPATTDQLATFYEQDISDAMHTVRSPEFLQWRIAAHPDPEEHFVLNLPQSGTNRCSAIARIVEEDNCRRLHLLTLRVDPFEPGKLSDLLAGIVRWALAENIDIISMVTSDPGIARTARWWLPVLKQLRYAYHADDAAGKAFLSNTDQSWEYIDGDFDLTYNTPNREANSRSLTCA